MVLLFNTVSVCGQSNSCPKTTEGTDFWFGFMEGRTFPSNGYFPYTEITITSSHYCNYKIYIGKSKIPFVLPAPANGTLQPFIPVQIKIPWQQVEAIGSEIEPFQQKAIHLVSDSALNVYALNWAQNSSEVALIYPTPSLGKEYYTMCYYPHYTLPQSNGNINGKNSEFLIVASEDNTVVNIWPSVLTDNNIHAGQLKTITLNQGEVYQVQAGNTATLTDSGDLTGSYITSDKPIAVFSGSYSTTIPKTSNNAWDHLYEQMPPIQSLGTTFIAVPLASRLKDTYRVLAAQDSTTIKVGNKPPIFLQKKGSWSEFPLLNTETSLIQSDKPVLLAQFSNSQSEDASYTKNNGDPFMVILSSVDQTREKVAFVAYTSPEIVKYFINVVVADSVVGNIFLDGNKVNFQSLSGTGYSYAQVPLINSQGNYNHYIESIVKKEGFIAWVYGFGGVEAYGYGVGYNLDVKLNLGKNINATGKLLVRCDGAGPLTIDAGNAFVKYKWNTGNPGDTTSVIKVSNPGWYKLTATTSDGCVLTDSVELRISKPSVFLGRDTTICNPSTIVLDAGAKFDSYLWSTPSGQLTTQSIVASNPGIYSVAVKDLYQCPATDSIKVSFVNKPTIISDKIDSLMCGKFSTLLNVSADKNVTWSLESPDPKVNINGLSVSVAPADQGKYPFILTAKDTFSCVSSKALNLGFYKSPVVNLGNDSTICNPQTITLNAGSQFADYTWSTTEKTPSITVKNNGTYSVNITDIRGCKTSDTVKIAFTDPPKILNISSIDTLICGPFTTTLKLSSDKVATYLLESTNPKVNINGLTASVAPADFGTYPVTITAKDQFSCSTSYNSKLGFYKTPTVGFTIDDKTCSGYNLDVSYVGNADKSSTNFNWNFGGVNIANGTGLSSLIVPLGINRTGRDLSLKVTEDGCSNSFTQKDIKVIPNLSMISNNRLGCEPFSTQFSANNTEVVVYDWDFGDGSPIQRTNNQPFHTYQKAGYYNVDLRVTTIVANGAGCVNEVKIDSMIHVAPIPTVGFAPTLKGQCLNAGDHQISYSGSGDTLDKYIWDLSAFDGGEIIQNPNNTQGPLIFNLKNKPQATIGLKVISKYGCQSIDSTVLVKRKPVFSFSSSSNAGCTPLEMIFTGKVSDPVDMVNYTWNFGDGAKGSGDQVNHIYTDPDHQYDVGLTALSSITACSDTIGKKASVITRPKPVAAFTLDNKIVYNDKPTINFSNESAGATSYLWDFGDGLTTALANPSHDFAATGYRTVLLEAFNNFSCYDTISHQILVAFDRIFPPTAFSPNAPNPVDQEYKLTSVGVMAEGYRIEIFSRWNDLVFEAKDEIKGWDGRIKNGDYAPAGNYVWILDYSDFLGRKHRQTGTVTLVY